MNVHVVAVLHLQSVLQWIHSACKTGCRRS